MFAVLLEIVGIRLALMAHLPNLLSVIPSLGGAEHHMLFDIGGDYLRMFRYTLKGTLADKTVCEFIDEDDVPASVQSQSGK